MQLQSILFLGFGLLTCLYLFIAVIGAMKLIKEVKILRKDVNYLNDALGQAESQIQNDIRKFHEDSILHTDLKIKDLDKRIKKLNEEVNRKFNS